MVPENPISPVSMLSVSGEPSALDCQRTLGQNTADSGLQAFPPTLANFDFGLDIAVRAAQQQTGAAAAALALTQDNLLVCRARVGNGAPSLGVPLNETVGMTGACVRTGEVLYCSDAETDLRVDICLCRELNIRSILVVPILEAKAVAGVVEVLSPQDDAFNATHVGWLIQLARFIQALTGSAKPSSPQTTTPARTKSALQATDEKAETGRPTKSADGAASQQDDENELAVIRDVLQHRVGTASWDEISQELVSRLSSHENSKALQSVKGETEKNAIASALEKTVWNRKAAARLPRISYRALLYKIQQYL